jgi:nitrous oxidase accessory protein NosD
MTTKTLSSLIIAGVLAGSAAAAVQVIDPPLTSGPGTYTTEPAASDAAPLLVILPSAERFAATSAGLKQRPPRILRLTR